MDVKDSATRLCFVNFPSVTDAKVSCSTEQPCIAGPGRDGGSHGRTVASPPRHDGGYSNTNSKGICPGAPEGDRQGGTCPEQGTAARGQESWDAVWSLFAEGKDVRQPPRFQNQQHRKEVTFWGCKEKLNPLFTWVRPSHRLWPKQAASARVPYLSL